ncbi:transporter substrate-binding domain-containing protein [Pseudomonas syringae]|jgi:ABC-type amino acid transport substrate-binding protein|uniref:Transporter substrate-binding domain-containing protein n=1 Tax=Pseudomonas syringae TaxID=317 RepID=A0A9Q3X5Q9_PSESX|nr:transporter substrate-binding domain-containing protein [Pseudomonas syringae]MCF5065731.1 transporter substrate-binding domain-containing protein [Pseudomonas syringae]MCF5075071.1 transporter substrate-binding domain-containing protein [Pseudomonas syringae]MCF5121230.1 transporter substrate-binding domain-containing protein [Pseudomonas syringae]MCF5381150.1 transporter substrate-binding domain-containing protein [Pseudomonas syringae]
MTTARRMLTLATFSLILLAGTGCAVAPQPESPWREIRFGVEADVPPFEYRNAQGELAGLDIELGNALCAELNARCVWVDQPYATNIAALQAGRFDAIMPMTATPARRETLDFTHDLYALESRLVAPRGSNLLPIPQSLRGKRIGVLAGTSREAFAKARWASQGVTVRSFGLNRELIRSLQAGEIDATLQNTVEINEALLNTPEGVAFTFAGPAIVDDMLGGGVAIATRKTDPTLTAALNTALQRLKDNGKYAAITGAYLGAAPPKPVKMIYTPAEGGLPFSETVQVGQTLYISGLLGLDANGDLVPGGIRGETAQVFKTLRGILQAKGIGMDRVAKCMVILADLKDFAAMNQVYASSFPADRLPTRTTVGAKLLANAQIEVECMASL